MQDLSWANPQTLQSVTWDDVQPRVALPVRTALEKVLTSLDGGVLTREECLALANCSGDDLFGLVVAANELRRRLVGDVVSYVVTRNINFTNVCFVGCKFCAFSVGPRDETAYFLSLDEVGQKCARSRAVGRDRGLHSGRAAAQSAAVLLSRHPARGEVGHAQDARACVLADGDGLRRRADRHAAARVPPDVEGKRARYLAGHGGGDSRRQRAPRTLAPTS